jgi:hypothetical protein
MNHVVKTDRKRTAARDELSRLADFGAGGGLFRRRWGVARRIAGDEYAESAMTVAEWSTIASLATALGTLILAVATFSAAGRPT